MKSCVLFYVLSAWLRIYFVLGLGVCVCVFANGETERENAPSICLLHWDESTAKLQSRLMNRLWIHSLLYGLFTCVSKQTGVWLGGFVCMRERETKHKELSPFGVCVKISTWCFILWMFFDLWHHFLSRYLATALKPRMSAAPDPDDVISRLKWKLSACFCMKPIWGRSFTTCDQSCPICKSLETIVVSGKL